MSKYHAGDKFVITVAEVFEGSNTLYRIKGFNTCIFDAKGLDKLDALREEDTESFLQAKYNEGWNDGYRAGCAREKEETYPKEDKHLNLKDLEDMYSAMIWAAKLNHFDSIEWAKRMDELTPEYILYSYKTGLTESITNIKGIKEYLQENLIEIGTEVRVDYPTESRYGVITKIYTDINNNEHINVLMEDGEIEDFKMFEVGKLIHKTGKIYRIAEILEELKARNTND